MQLFVRRAEHMRSHMCERIIAQTGEQETYRSLAIDDGMSIADKRWDGKGKVQALRVVQV